MTGRRPQLDWERQGWTLTGPDVPGRRPVPNQDWTRTGTDWAGWNPAGWWLPEPAPVDPTLRIGDAERDRAITELGEHFAAGRLRQEEFDERSARALEARVQGDLQPLFVDLPRTGSHDSPSPRPPMRGYPPQRALFWLAPVLAVTFLVAAVTVAIVLHAPWVIWLLLGLFLVAGPWRRRRFGPPLGPPPHLRYLAHRRG